MTQRPVLVIGHWSLGFGHWELAWWRHGNPGAETAGHGGQAERPVQAVRAWAEWGREPPAAADPGRGGGRGGVPGPDGAGGVSDPLGGERRRRRGAGAAGVDQGGGPVRRDAAGTAPESDRRP